METVSSHTVSIFCPLGAIEQVMARALNEVIHFRRKASWPSLGLADVFQMWYGDFVVNVMDNDDFSLIGALPGDIVAFRPSANNSDKLMSLEFNSDTEKVELIISSNPFHNDAMPMGIIRNLQ